MEHTVITKAQLKEKSENLKIPFPNLLAGYLLEELMFLISESEYSRRLWLKNDQILGVEQYCKRESSLTLDFAYVVEGQKKEEQKLTLKLAYIILLQFLQNEKNPKVKWKGKVELQGNVAKFDIVGEFEEMTVPFRVILTQIEEEKNCLPEKKQCSIFMSDKEQISYYRYPVEMFLAEQIAQMLKQMELIQNMEVYLRAYDILTEAPMDGRHVGVTLSELCEKEHIPIDTERVEELISYREYSYMRKKWDKYVRQCGKEKPNWHEVVDKLEKFLVPIWEKLCLDEVFFGDWMPDLERFLD